MRVKLAARSTVLNASELSTVGIEFSTGDDGWQYRTQSTFAGKQRRRLDINLSVAVNETKCDS